MAGLLLVARRRRRSAERAPVGVIAVVVAVALAVVGCWALRAARPRGRLYPLPAPSAGEPRPACRRRRGLRRRGSRCRTTLRTAVRLMAWGVVPAWALGGLRDRACTGAAARGGAAAGCSGMRTRGARRYASAAAVALFMLFTVRASLWLLDVVVGARPRADRPGRAGRRRGAAAVLPRRARRARAGACRRSPSSPSSPPALAERGDDRGAGARMLEVRGPRPRRAARGPRAGPRLPRHRPRPGAGRRPVAAALGRDRHAPSTSTACPSLARARRRGWCARPSPTCCATPGRPGRRSPSPTACCASATTAPSRGPATRRGAGSPGWPAARDRSAPRSSATAVDAGHRAGDCVVDLVPPRGPRGRAT